MAQENIELIDIERFSPVELDDILKECRRFNDIMSLNRNLEYKEEEALLRSIREFQRARLCFSKAKNMLSTFFKPEENAYIKEAEDQHHGMVDDLGRVEKNLDSKNDSFTESLRRMENELALKNKVTFARISTVYNFLNESMNAVVINPLKQVFRRYMRLRSKIIADKKVGDNGEIIYEYDLKETREKIFVYWLFLEVYHGSLYVGAITREERPKNVTSKGNNQNFSYDFPSTIPNENIGLTNRDLSKQDSIEELFSDPFSEVEEDVSED